jgi:hypothetical protein
MGVGGYLGYQITNGSNSNNTKEQQWTTHNFTRKQQWTK